jgi:hypothetical protein
VIRALLVFLLLLARPAFAETRRVAVIVGNNAGSGEQAPLRYAEIDASKVSRVLLELGGVAQADLFLLQGKDVATLDATLRRAKERIAAYQTTGLDRVFVLFYYSGHSDGVALELGHDRFTFAALRNWLKDTGADVRVALIDACKSGALLAAKGGTPGPAFQIRLSDDLASTGEALLTSSAADENALESKEIGGSFFTHHLVSGLRGAADVSGDARVTLTEAYEYAYKHTIATSGATLAGTQHPAYDFRLSGQGELILTELAQPSAALALPDGFDRALVIEIARDQVIAELGRGALAQVAVVPGKYGVRAWKQDRVFEGKVVVAASAVRRVRWDELHAIELPATRAKGGVEVTSRYEIGVTVGARDAVAAQLDVLAGARITFGPARIRGWSVALEANTASTRTLRETSAFALGGYHFGVARGRLHAWIGAEAGAGAILQSLDKTSASAALAAGPLTGVSLRLVSSLALGFTADARTTLLQRDGSLSLAFLPAGWLGLTLTR